MISNLLISLKKYVVFFPIPVMKDYKEVITPYLTSGKRRQTSPGRTESDMAFRVRLWKSTHSIRREI